jgi:DNA-binding MltR family transcriptional regulator
MDNNLSIPLDEYFPQHLREVVEFRTSLSHETDRGCALMVASLLDKKLEDLLRASFVDDSKAIDEILSQSGSLGTFSSRIDAAYLFGLIGPNIRRDLHLIRKIRNLFGHHHLPLSFDDDRIANRCAELYHHTLNVKESSRKVFIRTTVSILTTLNVDIIQAEHATAGRDLYDTDDFRQKYRAQIEEMRETVDQMPDQEKQKVLDSFFQILNREDNA